MQQINNIVSLVQAQASLAQPISSERKRDKHWSVSTEKLVILVFTRMADLFGHKAISRGFVIFADAEKGIYSESFELWCRKLDDLSADDFKRGVAGLESKAEDDYKQGNEMWPPSYAEFRALAFPKVDRDTLAHKPFPRLTALEDQTEKAKRYELGKQKSRELLDMLGASKPNPNAGDAEFGKARLEAAMKKLAQESAQ